MSVPCMLHMYIQYRDHYTSNIQCTCTCTCSSCSAATSMYMYNVCVGGCGDNCVIFSTRSASATEGG